MQHYFGARAIVERIGYKRPEQLPRLRARYGVPCFLRADPRNSKRRLYYASEAMIVAWELARASLELQAWIAKREQNQGPQ